MIFIDSELSEERVYNIGFTTMCFLCVCWEVVIRHVPRITTLGHFSE